MRIYKRGKIWWADWTIDGKRSRISSETETEHLAKAYLAQKYAEAFQIRKLGEKPRKTWTQATERYLADHESLRSIETYRKNSLWWSCEFESLKVKYLDEITPDLVRVIRDKELTRPKERGSGKRSAADVNRKLSYLRAVFNAAYRQYRWFGAGEEPPLFKLITGERQRSRHLTPAEVKRLVTHLPDPVADMALFSVVTGLRRNNVLRLQWDQIDLGNRSITFTGEVMKNGKPLSIPINDIAMEILKSRFGKSAKWVFASANGKPLMEISSKVWAKALKAAGLTDLRWHDLRHTWASIARQRGLAPELIQELGGWRDPRMVQRYSHLTTDHLHEAANEVGLAFGHNQGTAHLRGSAGLAVTG